MNKLNLGLPLILLSFLLFSCKKNNEATPLSWVAVDSVTVQTNFTEHGTASEKITDVWAYYNDNPVGIYELPAIIPLMEEGNGKLTLYPGIKNGGAAFEREQFPFYETYVENVQLTAGDTIDVVPNYIYKSGIDIWQENFDDPSIKFSAESSAYGFRVSSDPMEVFEGDGVGIIEFIDPETFVRVQTSQSFSLPKQSAPVYLELNYKNDIPFKAYIIAGNGAYAQRYDIIEFYPKEDWNKMYLDLTFLVSNEISATYYEIGFEALLNGNPQDSKIYIDNVKLIY